MSRAREEDRRRRAAEAGVTPREVRMADEAAAMLSAPPLVAVTVSGGRLSDDAEARIRNFMERSRGRDTFHKVLVLEAEQVSADLPGLTVSVKAVER